MIKEEYPDSELTGKIIGCAGGTQEFRQWFSRSDISKSIVNRNEYAKS